MRYKQMRNLVLLWFALVLAAPVLAQIPNHEASICGALDGTGGCDGFPDNLGDRDAGTFVDIFFDVDEVPLTEEYCGYTFRVKTDPAGVFGSMTAGPSLDPFADVQLCSVTGGHIPPVGFPNHTDETLCFVIDITPGESLTIDDTFEATARFQLNPTYSGLTTFLPGNVARLRDPGNFGECATYIGGSEPMIGTEIDVTVVPEPGTVLGYSAGAGLLALLHRRRSWRQIND